MYERFIKAPSTTDISGYLRLTNQRRVKTIITNIRTVSGFLLGRCSSYKYIMPVAIEYRRHFMIYCSFFNLGLNAQYSLTTYYKQKKCTTFQ